MGKSLVAAISLLAFAWLTHAAFEDATLPRADLVIGNGPDPRSLDPAQTSAIADGRILAALFEGLMTADPVTSKPMPGLAASVDIAPDGLRYRFRLRDGLRWSDGVPMTAEDLRWSFLRFLDPTTAARTTDLLDAVVGAREFALGRGPRDEVGIRVDVSLALVFDLSRPSPAFLDILSLFPLAPVPRHVVEKYGRRWTRPEHCVVSGPFRLVRWRLRDRVRVERNPLYWDAGNVRLATLDFLCVDSATTLLNLFVTGAADVVTDVPPSAVPALRERFAGQPSVFDPAPRLGTFFYRINVTEGVFKNRKLRRALGLAIDREAITRDLLRAGEIPAETFVPPGVRAGERIYVPPPGFDFDLAAARRLLAEAKAEAGIEEIPPFEVLYSTEPGDQSIAELLQHQWRELGITCRLVNLDGQTLRSRLVKRDYSVARSSWIGDFVDPSTFLDQFATTSAGNRTGFSDPDYDRLVLDAAPRAQGEERVRLLAEAEARLLDQAPILPIYHYASRALVAPRVQGFTRNLLDWHPPRFLGVEER